MLVLGRDTYTQDGRVLHFKCNGPCEFDVVLVSVEDRHKVRLGIGGSKELVEVSRANAVRKEPGREVA